MSEVASSSKNTNNEKMIIDLAKSKPNGIAIADINQILPDLPLGDITAIINNCLRNGSLNLFKLKGELIYKYKDPSQKTAVKGADNEERLVYKIIEEAENKGIWIRDIRVKSNLNITQLNKILKSMETKKRIKAVKSVAASKKKVYMLYDLEADTSVTGGAWYQDQDFELEFVDILNQQCYRYLQQKLEEANNMGGGPLIVRNKSYATANDVHKYISESKISKVPLSVKDIESILYTVVLDYKAERIVTTKGSYLYKAVNSFLQCPGLAKISCGICPVSNRCGDTGSINCNTCPYLSDWLESEF